VKIGAQSRHWLLTVGPLPAAVALAVLSPSDEGGSGVCMWRLCTGSACPGCGLTRSVSHLLRGDLARSIGFHPLGPFLAIQLVAAWGLYLAVRRGWVRPLPVTVINVWLAANVPLLVGVWLVRMASGTLPPV
jgi:hypothetical protein